MQKEANKANTYNYFKTTDTHNSTKKIIVCLLRLCERTEKKNIRRRSGVIGPAFGNDTTQEKRAHHERTGINECTIKKKVTRAMLAHIIIQCIFLCVQVLSPFTPPEVQKKKGNKHFITCLHGIHSSAYMKAGFRHATPDGKKAMRAEKAGTDFAPLNMHSIPKNHLLAQRLMKCEFKKNE